MLTDEQAEDLAQLHLMAAQFGADIVIIGAVALLCFIDLGGFTKDVDLAVALDLEDFAAFSARLTSRGWTQEPHREHRWRGPGGALLDLMPAGPNLRAAKQVAWPESQFVMSLVGFNHVFTRAFLVRFPPGVEYKVAPPFVIGLLKIVSYMDDPHRRKKDLTHISALFRQYELMGERIFSDEVFAAELEDIGSASAFLLGSDIGKLATNDEASIVDAFLLCQCLPNSELLELDREDVEQRETVRFQEQLRAFGKGFRGCRNP